MINVVSFLQSSVEDSCIHICDMAVVYDHDEWLSIACKPTCVDCASRPLGNVPCFGGPTPPS